jgi:hypothetical protein
LQIPNRILFLSSQSIIAPFVDDDGGEASPFVFLRGAKEKLDSTCHKKGPFSQSEMNEKREES